MNRRGFVGSALAGLAALVVAPRALPGLTTLPSPASSNFVVTGTTTLWAPAGAIIFKPRTPGPSTAGSYALFVSEGGGKWREVF